MTPIHTTMAQLSYASRTEIEAKFAHNILQAMQAGDMTKAQRLLHNSVVQYNTLVQAVNEGSFPKPAAFNPQPLEILKRAI